MKEVVCPSGAVLKITLSPFAIAKGLYQCVLKELKGLNIDSKTELTTLYKEIFCTAFSSKEVESALFECFKRCTYNSGKGDLKIDESTFEPEQARQDYMTVCIEVGKENILPFTKSLLSEYQRILSEINTNTQT